MERTMTDPQGKQNWTFDQNMAPELRKVRALEYIAHFLDRIEVHLGRLADQQAGVGKSISASISRDLKEFQVAMVQNLKKA
jgi:hypothetical protein